MAHVQHKSIDQVGGDGPGLVFIVYPQAIAMMDGSVFWSIIFFLMLITLGLDSTFGGLEAMITALCDEYPRALGRKREIFVLVLLIGIYLCALPTMTYVSSPLLLLLCYSNCRFCRLKGWCTGTLGSKKLVALPKSVSFNLNGNRWTILGGRFQINLIQLDDLNILNSMALHRCFSPWWPIYCGSDNSPESNQNELWAGGFIIDLFEIILGVAMTDPQLPH